MQHCISLVILIHAAVLKQTTFWDAVWTILNITKKKKSFYALFFIN